MTRSLAAAVFCLVISLAVLEAHVIVTPRLEPSRRIRYECRLKAPSRQRPWSSKFQRVCM